MLGDAEEPSRTPQTDQEIIIIGAGLCGLMTALSLIDLGPRILILDKGRSVGGRMATRHVGPGRADHGAQFFTVRTIEFAHYVEEWRLNNWVFEWATNWSDGSLHFESPIGHARFAARDGMNVLAKHLANQLISAGVEIRLDERVTSLVPNQGRWSLTTAHGFRVNADQLVATTPVPQLLALLDESKTTLPGPTTEALTHITYAPCLCLLIWVDGDVALPHPGARHTPSGVVSWIADNQRKGISPGARILTIHANPHFSAHHYDADDTTVSSLILPEIEPLLAATTVQEVQVKRWRYALPTTIHPDRYLYTHTPAPLYIGGDAFGGPRMEGAAVSGLAMGTDLRKRLGYDQHRAIGEA